MSKLSVGSSKNWANKADLLAATGLRAADGAEMDAATGWPKRVVHERSGAVLVLIPAGEFMMGSPEKEEGRSEDERLHRRVIRNAFYLGETAVTEEQWERVMGSEPRGRRGPDFPVVNVSWSSCQDFLRKAGGGLRLPSEAEWEYGCRAGTASPFSFGENISPLDVNFDGDHPYGSAKDDPPVVLPDYECGMRGETVACRSLPANPWGLFEMHGNVWEWCQDVMAEYPRHGDELPWEGRSAVVDGVDRLRAGLDALIAEIKESDTLVGSADACDSSNSSDMESARAETRIMRGGCWSSDGGSTRSASRGRIEPDFSDDDVGFRVACSLPA